jgi:hypothetical protein
MPYLAALSARANLPDRWTELNQVKHTVNRGNSLDSQPDLGSAVAATWRGAL